MRRILDPAERFTGAPWCLVALMFFGWGLGMLRVIYLPYGEGSIAELTPMLWAWLFSFLGDLILWKRLSSTAWRLDRLTRWIAVTFSALLLAMIVARFMHLGGEWGRLSIGICAFPLVACYARRLSLRLDAAQRDPGPVAA